MSNKGKTALKVALLGMDERTYKTLAQYLLGPCKNAAITVSDDNDAEVNIIDADLPRSRVLLEKLLHEKSARPLIVLSLKPMGNGSFLFVQKPIQTDAMLAVLAQAREHIQNADKDDNQTVLVASLTEVDQNADASGKVESDAKPSVPAPLKRHTADLNERNKTSKHRAAMHMDEKGFTALMGGMKSVDIGDSRQVKDARYNPRDYFQGYLQSAFKVSRARAQVLQLNSGWKPVLIFPHSNEVWLDADDRQLRAFASIIINKNDNQKMSLTEIKSKPLDGEALDKFQTMDALLWKLACWTSKGRYPEPFDIERPFYLKHWPNFTRLLVTPHALRIAALLIEKPRTATNIARTLHIKPEYVFVFISAAAALGLLGQAARNADIEVAPQALKPDKKQGLLRRIINKLRLN
ncbi:MAG: hypothetical protein CVV13_02775 [Gammaproteobacteria bacterium HGW-Gammaproteobacteria-3]|nr:MAG: hypothetical protein CVV13_02775 [Gammaproteobacteria bacterium HGW-Gammaproteobacteria-3]